MGGHQVRADEWARRIVRHQHDGDIGGLKLRVDGPVSGQRSSPLGQRVMAIAAEFNGSLPAAAGALRRIEAPRGKRVMGNLDTKPIAVSRDPLFRPFTVKTLTLKNRIVMSAMGQANAKNGVPDPGYPAYYRRRASSQRAYGRQRTPLPWR
jgi:hypothetical protein